MVDDLNHKFTPTGNISDELLSAYLDGQVTPEERALVERTVAGSSDVAWRLDALRQTVVLMGQLPRVPLPRSFTLSEADVRPAGRQRARWWDALLNPVFLRNATAVATMLFLVVLVGNVMLSSLAPAAPASPSATVVVQAPVQMVAKEIAPAAANEATASVAPSTEPAALSAGAPAPAEATTSAEAAPPSEMPLPSESMAVIPAPEATRVPAPASDAEAPPVATTALAQEDSARSATAINGEATAPPTNEATSTMALAGQAEATAAVTTLAETAPAVEITGAALEVPAPGAAPARPLETLGRSWLDLAALVLGGLALLLFVAWQLRLRAGRGSQ